MNTQTKPREDTKPVHPLVAFGNVIESRTDQLKHALPPHIPVERFMRVVMTALQSNPKLLACTQQSLWNSCMKAAQEGLLPDGREGAIVPYGENEDGRKIADNATWMPMIAGLKKKVRNSGEIKDWYIEIVYGGDHFLYQKGDDPKLEHIPVPPSQRTKSLPYQGIIAAYSIAVFKDGSKSVPEVMWIEEIEGVRSKSKAKKGPWADPIFYPEMCKKTVARRHYKSLPQSTDLDDLMRNDDTLYDFSEREDTEPGAHGSSKRLTSVADALDTFAGATIDHESANEPSIVPDQQLESAAAGNAAWPLDQVPANSDEYVRYACAHFAQESDAEQRIVWFRSGEQRILRNACQVSKEHYADLQKQIAAKPAATVPAPDQDPEGFIAFVRDGVAAAKTREELDDLFAKHVKPVESVMFPPDRGEVEQIFARRAQEIA